MNDSSFKDLQKSINGFDWLQNEYDENLLNLISQNYTVAYNVAKILSKKKIPFGQIHDFLNTKIKNGDVVEILTSKKQNPSIGWQKFVVTTKARNEIFQKKSRYYRPAVKIQT